MNPIKRIEVVVEAVHERSVERMIDKAGINGYTLLRNVAGRGHRGERDADGLTVASQNVCFIVAAPPEEATRLVEALRPLLKRSGGMCLVSEAQWLAH